MIKYLGSKRTIVPDIVDIIRQCPNIRSVLDVFSGTSRVGFALKRKGYQVFANDLNGYAATLAKCYIETDIGLAKVVQPLVLEMNRLPGSSGYFTETFCKQSRFFHPKNGERIDAIREWIEAKDFDPELKAVLLVSLMEAADRVDSTTGLQMAYLKEWAPRAHNDLELRMPELAPQSFHGKGKAFQLDALEACKTIKADLAYLDPPYNQHSYLGNYHIWESLILWDKPEVYGVACKRIDVKRRKSDFNSKLKANLAFKQVINACQSPNILVSFNDEGYIDKDDMVALLESKGTVTVFAKDYKRYVGAQIGQHNKRGKRVGKVSHLRNTEYLYLVGNYTKPFAFTGNP
jgi:adenine-specific DNA-methyltransferase